MHSLKTELLTDPSDRGYRRKGQDYPAIAELVNLTIIGPNPEPQARIVQTVPVRDGITLADVFTILHQFDPEASKIVPIELAPVLDRIESSLLEGNIQEIGIWMQIISDKVNAEATAALTQAIQELSLTKTITVDDPNWEPEVILNSPWPTKVKARDIQNALRGEDW